MEKKGHVELIRNNYRFLEASIAGKLDLAAKHGTMTGTHREKVWKELFEQIIPQKFKVEQSVFVIDSTGKVSREVDLAIFDEQYTPYIFKNGGIKYIPIESLCCVVECKGKSLNTKSLEEWQKDISKLRTSRNSITRIASKILTEHKDNNCVLTQSSTRPLRILCCTAGKESYSQVKELFDIVIYKKKDKLCVVMDKEKTMEDWYYELNHVGINKSEYDKYGIYKYPKDGKAEEINPSIGHYEVKNNSLLSLVFQLNQILMLLNNPIPFPHMEYVKLFNDIQEERCRENECSSGERE